MHALRLGLPCRVVFVALLLCAALTARAENPAENRAGPRAEAAAANAASGPDSAPLNYRRVFVPADRSDQWPRGNERFVPMKAAEFQRLLKLAAERGQAGSGPSAARIVSAQYTARLAGDGLLAGEAHFQVSGDVGLPALVSLSPCGLALSDPRWVRDGKSQPATLGADQDDIPRLLVPRAGECVCDWTLRGRRAPGANVSFNLALPNVASSRLTLDLPEALTPHLDGGTVTSEAGAAQGVRRWRIELGGLANARLTLVPEQNDSVSGPATVLRQSMTYDFSPRGLEVTARLALDIHGRPLERLVVEMDPGLRVLDARLGDAELSWSPQPDKNAVVLEFPEPLAAAQRVVQIRAVAALQPGEKRRLPAVKPLGVFWQEGVATLLVPRPLTLLDLELSSARQTKVDTLPGSDGGDSLELQYFSPAAKVEVLVDRREASIHLAAATSLVLSPRQVRGRAVADCTVLDGERFSLAATLPRPWRVDTVESEPSGAIEQWSVQPWEGKWRLSMRLARAITPKQPLRIIVNGHLGDAALTRPIPSAELRMLDAPDEVWDERIVAIRCRDPFRLHVEGDEDTERLDLAQLSKATRSRLGDSTPDLVYADNTGARRLVASLQQATARHAAEIQVSLRARDRQLGETYRVVCRPDTGGIDRFFVHASQSRSTPPSWSIEDSPGERLSVRQLSAAQQRDAGFSNGETWELQLARPRSHKFTVKAERNLPLDGTVTAALVSIGYWTEQSGTLTVFSETGEPLELNNRRLKPIPIAEAELDRLNSVRAAYRYDPTRDVTMPGPPALTLALATAAGTPQGALIWRAWFESRFDVDGRVTTAVTFNLENDGKRRLRVELPPGSGAPQVLIDGVRVRTNVKENSPAISIDLPEGERFPTVKLEYTAQGERLGLWRTLTPQMPKVDMPVQAWHGLVWTPPGYRTLSGRPVDAVQTPGGDAVLGWSQRLFGPLARPEAERPFDPLNGRSWQQLFGRAESSDAARQRAGALLRQMGRFDVESSDTLTLGALLGSTTSVAETADDSILIDALALDRKNLGPQTPVPEVAERTSADRGAARLAALNLTLLADGDTLLLTTADETALQLPAMPPLFGGAVEFVSDGSLAHRVAKATDAAADSSANDSGLMELDRWNSSTAAPRKPWIDASSVGQCALERNGWSAARVDMLQWAPPQLFVVREAMWSTLGWSLLILVASVLWWWYPRRKLAWVLLVTILALASLLLPAAIAPLATTGLLGTLGAGLLAILWSPRPPAKQGRGTDASVGFPARRPTPSTTISHALAEEGAAASQGSQHPPSSTIARPTAQPEAGSSRGSRGRLMSWLLVAILVIPCAAVGAVDAPARAPIYSILIPVDKDKHPVGDTWYVPLEMFNELQQRAAVHSVGRSGWLTTGLVYRGRLAWNSARTRLDMTSFKAIYDVEVYGQQTQLRFPLRVGASRLLVRSVTLDGRSVDPLWDQQGRVLLVDVQESGHYRVEISPQAIEQEGDPPTSLELLGPALPTARLDLTTPSDAPAVDVLSALGDVRADASQQSVTAQLGGPGRLALGWAASVTGGSSQSEIDVEQLLWLKVHPGAVTLDTRLKFNQESARVRHFQLLADPRLRLLPLSKEAAGVMQVRTVAGDPQVIVIDLLHGLGDDQEVALSFLWTDSSGVGRLRIPLLAPLEARSQNAWLAVSVDPALRWELPDGTNLESVSNADFSNHWPTSAAAPDLAYQLPRGDVAWSLATRPRLPRTTVQQTLGLSFSPGSAAVRLAAQLETSVGHLFGYRINVPAGFVAQSVSLTQSDGERVARWSASGSVLTVFLNGPVDGSQQLSIRGEMPAAGPNLALPEFRLDHCHLENYDVAVYRRSGVNVQVSDAESLRELAEPSEVLQNLGDPSPERFGQFCGAYQLVNVGAPSVFNVSAEPLRSEARQVVTLGRRDGAWEATIDYRLRVLAGTSDVIRLRIPASLPGPFEISPKEPYQLVAIPGSQQRHLVIRPREPIRDELHMTISAPLAIADGDRVAVPSVTPLGVTALSNYVVLPKQVEQEQVHWEIRGLDPEPLPQDRDSPAVSDQSVSTYRVTDERFQAVLASVARVSKSPQIYLLDVRMACDTAGNFTAVAAYDLEPAGLAHCQLRVPQGVTLIAAQAAGMPASLSALEGGDWELSLVSDQLPQRIELLFRGQLQRGTGTNKQFLVPVLRNGDQNITVQHSLWTIDSLAGRAISTTTADVSRITALEQRQQRLENVTRLLADATSEESIEMLAPWYQRWVRRLSDTRRLIEQAQPTAGADRASIRVLLAENLRQQQQIAHRLRTSDVLQSVMRELPRADRAPQLWRWGTDARRGTLRLASAQGLSGLEISYQRDLEAGLGLRLALCVAIMAAAWLLLRTGLGTRLVDGGARWPQAVLVGLGLLAWLLLIPQVVGLLMATAALTATLRFVGNRP